MVRRLLGKNLPFALKVETNPAPNLCQYTVVKPPQSQSSIWFAPFVPKCWVGLHEWRAPLTQQPSKCVVAFFLAGFVALGAAAGFRRDRTLGERPLADDRLGDRQAGRLVSVRRAQRTL